MPGYGEAKEVSNRSQHIIYIPDTGEPSIFTKDPGVINPAWTRYCAKRLMGSQIVRGRDQFKKHKDAVDSFLDEPVAKDHDGYPKSKTDYYNEGVLGALVQHGGKTIQENVRKDLTLPPPAELLKPVGALATSDGHVKFRWVLHMCREEGMTPEEAHSYGLSLLRG